MSSSLSPVPDPSSTIQFQVLGDVGDTDTSPLIAEEIEVVSGAGNSGVPRTISMPMSMSGSSSSFSFPLSSPLSQYSIFKSPISNISSSTSIPRPRKFVDSNTIQIGRHKFASISPRGSNDSSGLSQRSNNYSRPRISTLHAPSFQIIKSGPQAEQAQQIFCPSGGTLIPINLPTDLTISPFTLAPIPIARPLDDIVVVKAEECMNSDLTIVELDESQLAGYVQEQEQQQLMDFQLQQQVNILKSEPAGPSGFDTNYGQFILSNPIELSELLGMGGTGSDGIVLANVNEDLPEQQPNDASPSTTTITVSSGDKTGKKGSTPGSGVQEYKLEADGTVVEIKKKGSSPEFKCQEPYCDQAVLNVQELKNHLSSHHNVIFLEEKLHFDSEEDFKSWKSEYECEHQVSFIYRGGTKKISTDKAVTYLICHRSGTYKSTVDGEIVSTPTTSTVQSPSVRKRKLKPQGSCKIGTYCTAGIKLLKNLSSGAIDASICHTHYGHDLSNPKHLRMNPKLKEEILAKFDAGQTFAEILQHIHHNPESLEGYRVIDRRAIRNIYDQWRKQSKTYMKTEVDHDLFENESGDAEGTPFTPSPKAKKRKRSTFRTSAPDFEEGINKLINHEENGVSDTVLYYKKAGHELPTRGHPTQHSLYLHDVCLILQTQVQRELLQKYGKIINLEEVLGGELDIVGIVVLDEFLMSIPVGWMITSNASDSMVQHFFSVIHSTCPELTCDYLFATRRSNLHKLWFKEFSHHLPRPLYPTEDTLRELKGLLRKFYDSSVKRANYYGPLEAMVTSPDKQIFDENLTLIKSFPDSSQLLHVFSQDWLEIKGRWAFHTRPHIPIFMEESFGKLRKFILFKGTKLLGKNIDDLLKISYDKIFQHNKSLFKGDIKQHTLLEKIKLKHQAAVNQELEGSVIELGNNKYQMGDEVIYDLKTICNCEINCGGCGYCAHRFHCSCSDKVFCIHAHGLGLFLCTTITNIKGENDNRDPLELVIVPDDNVNESAEVPVDKEIGRWGVDDEYLDIMCTEIEEGNGLPDHENDPGQGIIIDIDCSGLKMRKDTPALRRRGEPRATQRHSLPPTPTQLFKPDSPFCITVEVGNYKLETGTPEIPNKKAKKGSGVVVTPIITKTTPNLTPRSKRLASRLQLQEQDEDEQGQTKLKETPQKGIPKTPPKNTRSKELPPKRKQKEIASPVAPAPANAALLPAPSPVRLESSASPPLEVRTTRSSVKKEREPGTSTTTTIEDVNPEPQPGSSATPTPRKPGRPPKFKQPIPDKTKKETLRKELIGIMDKIDHIQDERVLSRLRKKMTDLSSVIDSG